MCFSSKLCLETRRHSMLQTPFAGHCLSVSWGGKARLANGVWRHSPANFSRHHLLLVSHYSAIGDTISCDAPYSAMGFRGKFFVIGF